MERFMRKIIGFTLAEVLITLGIIGIVAALILPPLIQDYRNHVVETRLKKFYSTMNQAIALSINDNGDVETWDYFNHDIHDKDGNTINRTYDNDKSFQKYLAPYLKIVDKKETTGYGEKRILYFFEDGSAFMYARHENRDLTFFPKNAEKCISKQTQLGICNFAFSFYPISSDSRWKYLYNKRMEAHLFDWDGSISKLYSDSDRGCKNIGLYCTAIIQFNEWKIPKDYPKRVSF